MEQPLRSSQRAKLQSKHGRNAKPGGALGCDKQPRQKLVLPSLGLASASQVQAAPSVWPQAKPAAQCGEHRKRQSKPPHLIDKLQLAHAAHEVTPFDNQRSPPSQLKRGSDTVGAVETKGSLPMWVARTRQMLESLLSLQRAVDAEDRVSASMSLAAQQKALARDIAQSHAELSTVLHENSIDPLVQAQCFRMLDRMMAINDTIEKSLKRDQHRAEGEPASQKPTRMQIPDAQVVIKGTDGKKMFFKLRNSSIEISKPPTVNLPVFVETSVAPLFDSIRHTPFGKGLAARLWPDRDFLAVRRVKKTLVIVRAKSLAVIESNGDTDEHANKTVMKLSVYCSKQSTSHEIAVSRLLLSLTQLLPNSSPKSRCENVMISSLLSCLSWTDDNNLRVQLPVQHRQARILSYRTFETRHSLITLRVGTDFICQVRAVDVRAQQTQTLTLSPSVLRPVVGDHYPNMLLQSTSRRDIYRLICRKLFLEYTTKGFELLFPGIKPSGRPCRHPAEIKLAEHYQRELLRQREAAKRKMYACALQAAAVGKQKSIAFAAQRTKAAEQLQLQTRRLLRQRQHQRLRFLQLAAATVIQARIRRVLAARRVQRMRSRQRYDLEGSFFKLGIRVNQTFLLASIRVTINAICVDGSSGKGRWLGIDGLHISLCHPVSHDVASTCIDGNTLSSIAQSATSNLRTRRELVEFIVRQHLDVFRSTQHNLLVLALKT